MSELAEVLKGVSERRIDDMLTHYRDAQEGQDRSADILGVHVHGGDHGHLELPDVWKRSGYPTLERLLAALKLGADLLEGPALYSHLCGWYFRVRRVRVPAYIWVLDSNGRPKLDGDGEPVARRNGKGDPIRRVHSGVDQFELRNRREPFVDQRRVVSAVEWLASSWPPQAKYRPELLEEIVKRVEREREQLKAAA